MLSVVLNKPYLISTVTPFDLFGIFLWVSGDLIFYGAGFLALRPTFTTPRIFYRGLLL
jgi:hypothetical protein